MKKMVKVITSLMFLMVLVIAIFVIREMTGFFNIKKENERFKSRLCQAPVQAYVKSWILSNISDRVDWKARVKDVSVGICTYSIAMPSFDWSVLGVDRKNGAVGLLGTPDNVKGIVFYGIGRCALIYSCDGTGIFNEVGIEPDEITLITNNFYFFEPKLIP